MSIPEVRLITMIKEPREEGQIVPADSHKWYEFVYYISCSGKLLLSGAEFDIIPGRYCIISPSTLHSETHLKNGIVFFCIFKCDIDLKSAVYDDDASNKILRICEKLMSERMNSEAFAPELQVIVMQELILNILRLEIKHNQTGNRLENAKRLIEVNFTDKLNLKKLAESVSYSYDHFQHIFKRLYGLSPKRYQTECRLKYALELLGRGQYNCTEIAYLCGFSNSAQFITVFRNNFGVTPFKWRFENSKS